MDIGSGEADRTQWGGKPPGVNVGRKRTYAERFCNGHEVHFTHNGAIACPSIHSAAHSSCTSCLKCLIIVELKAEATCPERVLRDRVMEASV